MKLPDFKKRVVLGEKEVCSHLSKVKPPITIPEKLGGGDFTALWFWKAMNESLRSYKN